MNLLPTLLAVVAAVSLPSGAQPVETEFGSSAATTLHERRPDNNFGKEIHFAAGSIQDEVGTAEGFGYPRNRGLIQFDIAGNVPYGATILSAQLVVWVILQPPADEGSPNMSFNVHRMLVPWVEGDGVAGGGPPIGSPAAMGESTWNSQFHGTTPWGQPGGLAGVDYASATSGTVSVGSPEVGQTDCNPCSTSATLGADVQFWLDNPSQNYGLMFKAADETQSWSAKQFMVPESQIDDYPRLIVTYTEAVPEPSTVVLASFGALALLPLLRRRAAR